MRDKAANPSGSKLTELAAIGIAAGAACCAVPALLAAGVGGTFLGASLGSWALLVAGLVAVVAGYVLWSRRRARCGDRR